MRPLIFEDPATRPRNAIGSWTMVAPRRCAHQVVWIGKPYPEPDVSRSRIAATSSRRQALKPPVRSRYGSMSTVRAKIVPPRLMTLRYHGQPTVEPPGI